jgi:hypothetical protein
MKTFLSFLLFMPFLLVAEVIRLDGVDFHYRIPEKYNSKSKIMVLFGGRNWQGERTLKTYNFNALADKHCIFLLSPSFKDRDYWEPQVWSGKLLQKAIRQLEKCYNLQPRNDPLGCICRLQSYKNKIILPTIPTKKISSKTKILPDTINNPSLCRRLHINPTINKFQVLIFNI